MRSILTSYAVGPSGPETPASLPDGSPCPMGCAADGTSNGSPFCGCVDGVVAADRGARRTDPPGVADAGGGVTSGPCGAARAAATAAALIMGKGRLGVPREVAAGVDGVACGEKAS